MWFYLLDEKKLKSDGRDKERLPLPTYRCTYRLPLVAYRLPMLALESFLPADIMMEINAPAPMAVEPLLNRDADDTYYDYYGQGVPSSMRLADCPSSVFRQLEKYAEPYSAPGTRFLVYSERIQYEELILHIEYITTRVAYANPLGGWIRQAVCYVEGTLSPYPYDIDLIHAEGEFEPMM